MSRRIDKVNKHIQRVFGEILLTEADIVNGAFVTVSRVETSENLRSCTVWLYISPLELAPDVLERFKKQMYDLQGSFNRTVSLNPLPRIQLRLDTGLDYAQHIDKKLNDIT